MQKTTVTVMETRKKRTEKLLDLIIKFGIEISIGVITYYVIKIFFPTLP